MSSESHTSVRDALSHKLEFASQILLGVIFGLLPLFFIPLEGVPFAYAKVVLVVVGILLSVILYSFAILRKGIFRATFSWPIAVLWLIVIAASASTLLSGDVKDSFIGDYFEPQTAFFVLVLAAVATAVAYVFNTRASVMRLYIILAVSTLILSLFHVLRVVLGAGIIPLGGFETNQTLTPLGSFNDLGLFFGLSIIISLVALEQLALTRAGKIFFASVAVAALGMLMVINFSMLWIVLGLISLVSLVYAVGKDRLLPAGAVSSGKNVSMVSFVISCAVLVVSILFTIGGEMIQGPITRATGVSYVEVRPSFEATANVAKSVLKEDPLFGIGPNKFSDAWRLYKEDGINSTIFWSTDFSSGVGYIPTFFITTGLIGGLLWCVFLALFVAGGIRMLTQAHETDRVWYFIGTSAFISGVYIWGMALFYVPGPLLMIMAAVCTGILVGARRELMRKEDRMIAFTGSRQKGFFLIAVTIAAVVGSVSGLYGVGRHMGSTYEFAQSSTALAAGDIEESRTHAGTAYTYVPDDRHARRIAQIELANLIQIINTQEPSPELPQRFQETLVNAIRAAQLATALDGTEADNWSILGNIYAVVVPLKIENAYSQGLEVLKKARDLDPKNPARTFALAQLELADNGHDAARTYALEAVKQKPDYTDAIYLISQLDILQGNIASAIAATQQIVMLEPDNPVRYFQLGILELSRNSFGNAAAVLERAVVLRPDYSNARYYLALTYDQLGRRTDAIRELEEVLRLNPGNELVIDLLSKARAGKPLVDVAETNAAPIEEGVSREDGESSVTTDKVPDTRLLTPANERATEGE